MWKSILRTCSFLIISLIHVVPVQAEEGPLKFDPYVNWPIIGVTGLVVGGLTLFENDLAPKHCRWCDSNSLDRDLRNEVKWSNKNLANNLSHVTGFVASPLFAIGTHFWLDWKNDRVADYYTDYSIIAESTLIAALVGQAVQFSIGRERPDAHFSNQRVAKSYNNTSFYSGHTTIAFSLAVSSATIASMENDEAAPYIWAGGLLLAGTTAYLRLAADRHYFTDVLVGATVGSAIGFAVPYFLHSPKEKNTSSNSFHWMALPSPSGVLASVDWRW